MNCCNGGYSIFWYNTKVCWLVAKANFIVQYNHMEGLYTLSSGKTI